MSAVPFDNNLQPTQPPRHNKASDAMNGANDDAFVDTERRRMGMHTTHSQARGGAQNKKGGNVAQRDAKVAKQLNGAAGGSKQGAKNKQQPTAPAADPNEPAYRTDKVTIPLVWSITPKDQNLKAINIGETLEKHGITGDVSVLSMAGVHVDSTVPTPMLLTLKGASGKGEIVGSGIDSDGHKHTTTVPRLTREYAAPGKVLYERSEDSIALDELSAHMGVNIEKLKTDVQPYYGKGGSMAKTHVEVHQSRNPVMYDIAQSSTGLETLFEGDSVDNPSVILTKAEHKKLVDTYTNVGGYKRAGRVAAKDITAHLHHSGTSYDGPENHAAWDQLAATRGLTSAERKELSHPDASHRVTYDLEMVVAHKPAPNKDPTEDDE